MNRAIRMIRKEYIIIIGEKRMKIKNNRLIINENGIDEACEQIQKNRSK